MTQMRIGRILATIGDGPAALTAFESASEILNAYSESEPTDIEVRTELAKALTNLATYQRRVDNNFADALKNQETAIQIQNENFQQIASTENARFLAKMYNQLAFLYRMQNATQLQQDALADSMRFHEIANSLGLPQQRDYVAEVKARMNLANFLCQRDDHAEASTLYKKNIEDLRKKMDGSSEAAIIELLADNFSNSAICEQESGNQAGAIEQYNYAQSELEDLVAQYPDVASFKKSLRVCLINLANLHLGNQSFDEAVQGFEQSISILNELLAKYPSMTELRKDKAEDLIFLGKAQLGRSSLVHARHAFDSAKEIANSLVAEQPAALNTKELLADCLNQIALAEFELGDRELARSFMKDAVAILEEMTLAQPNNSEYSDNLNAAVNWLESSK